MLMIDETKLLKVLAESSIEHTKEIQEQIKNNETINTALETIKEMTNDLPKEKQKIIFYEIDNLSSELMRVCSDAVSKFIGDSIVKAIEE
jgi:hypothetical protein